MQFKIIDIIAVYEQANVMTDSLSEVHRNIDQ